MFSVSRCDISTCPLNTNYISSSTYAVFPLTHTSTYIIYNELLVVKYHSITSLYCTAEPRNTDWSSSTVSIAAAPCSS